MKPVSSRSAMMLRMLAGLSSSPDDFASCREPMGWPSEICFSISDFSKIRDLSFIMASFYKVFV